ncbi:MAG TPA: ABC transporter ATP-binding protein [Propionibacteriaceae bacterium]|nr:ABC transporter ATP-binding protein [Propionibacteriaceae bacterium]
MRVAGLVVKFGRRAVLDGLALEAKTGALTAVLGPNGAGKTTLIRCCTDLVRPSQGTVRVLGLPAGSRMLAGRVGLMPQSAGSWSGIKAIELLHYLAGLYANPLPVPALVERLGLTDCAKTPYRRLSGGQQQAVNLAGALIGRPELVFLDEPTAGMDPHARRVTWLLLRELRTNGVTMLLTTHALDEAEALADKVFIVDRGRVAISGTVRQLTKSGGSLESVFLTHTSARAGS